MVGFLFQVWQTAASNSAGNDWGIKFLPLISKPSIIWNNFRSSSSKAISPQKAAGEKQSAISLVFILEEKYSSHLACITSKRQWLHGPEKVKGCCSSKSKNSGHQWRPSDSTYINSQHRSTKMRWLSGIPCVTHSYRRDSQAGEP